MQKLRVQIVGDSRLLDHELDRAAKTTSAFGSKLRGLGKVAAFTAGGAALGGMFAILKTGAGEVAESQKVHAQLEAVIKSTAGAARVTAAGIEAYAAGLSGMSGVDDEAIASGSALIATFTKIRNEVGEGNDVFDQATSTALDMSVALGQDMKSSAMQLGKALQDPIQGVGALRRVGVSFTEAQKQQIEALVETGDTLGAQKLILRELNTEFGGSAKAAGETLPGKLARLRLAFEEMSGGIVQTAVPAVELLTTWALENWPRAQEAIESGTRVIGQVMGQVAKVISNDVMPVVRSLAAIAVETWNEVSSSLEQHWPAIERIFGRWVEAARAVGKIMLWIAQHIVIPVLKPLLTQVLPLALGVTIEALDKVTAAIEGVVQIFKFLGERVIALIVKPLFETVIPAAVAVARGALDKFADVIAKVRDIFSWIGANAADVWNGLRDVIVPVAKAIAGALEPVVDLIFAIRNSMQWIMEKADAFLGILGKLGSIGGKLGGIGSFFGRLGGRQHGGDVVPGLAYLVGETGREMFLSGQAGTILPNQTTEAVLRALRTGAPAARVTETTRAGVNAPLAARPLAIQPAAVQAASIEFTKRLRTPAFVEQPLNVTVPVYLADHVIAESTRAFVIRQVNTIPKSTVVRGGRLFME